MLQTLLPDQQNALQLFRFQHFRIRAPFGRRKHKSLPDHGLSGDFPFA
jgi:hypothetical protein